MKIISNEITNKVVYGRIKIDTRVGILEYSYQSGTGFDDNYQLESTFSKFHELTELELEQIHDLIILTI